MVVLVVGVGVAWSTYFIGIRSPIDALSDSGLSLGVYLPGAYGLEALGSIGEMISYAAVILPLGLINVIGSMQVIESASAAGDDFAPKETLLINGIGTVVTSFLGSLSLQLFTLVI